MAAAQAPDPACLEELRRRFDLAACDHPNIEAVVVFRPDLRQTEAECQARSLHFKPANPASENFNEELVKETKSVHAAWTCAVDWNRWIPPSEKCLEQLGGQRYWARILREYEYPELCITASSHLWECTLFGPQAPEIENTAVNRFNMFAADAARQMFPKTSAQGTALLSRWLIYLADRDEPLIPDARRQWLGCRSYGTVPRSPTWIPFRGATPKPRWWAVRLHNVFQLSRDAIGQAIMLASAAILPLSPTDVIPSPVPAGAIQRENDSMLTGGAAQSRRAKNEPSKDAIKVYRYQFATGKTQTVLADDPELMKSLGRKVTQGTISRYLATVKKWVEAGNVLPVFEMLDSKPNSIDPDQIELGARRDGRAKRQRPRRNPDNDI